jgi:large conductance mechanosensitive channel protein
VADLINPIIGLIIGGIDFSNMYVVLKGTVADGASLKTARDSGAAVFAYGSFLMAVLNFLIIAWVVFMLVKAMNMATAKMKREDAAAAAAAAAAEGADAGRPAGRYPRSAEGAGLTLPARQWRGLRCACPAILWYQTVSACCGSMTGRFRAAPTAA